jgi:penicillin-binding protein 2
VNSEVSNEQAQSRWQARWSSLRGSPRAVLLGTFIVAILGVFIYRLWYIQFVHGAEYAALASRQSTRLVRISAPRGLIYERNGEPLVRNIARFDVVVTPAYLPDDETEAEAVLMRLAVLLDMQYVGGLREMIDEVPLFARYQGLHVKRSVDRDTALVVAQEAMSMPGVSIAVESKREYPYGPLVAQALGYLLPIPEGSEEEYVALGYDPSADLVGMAGVEAESERNLRGQNGERLVEEDVLGREVRVIEDRSAPMPGDSVFLTIDIDLQRYVHEALSQALAAPSVNSPRGVSIVMDPQSGEILAMVSLPTYDNNSFVDGISVSEWNRLTADPHRPMLNHAIADNLPPGSVFKIVMATAGLEEGVLDGNHTRLRCPGEIEVPNKYFPNDPGLAQPFFCWNRAGHGSLDVVGGLAHSCDIFFYKVGGGFEETDFEGLGVEAIASYATLFGLGEPTGIELPGESGGLVPTARWKRQTVGESWSTGDTYNLSIGQGYLEVTPLQMLSAVNVVANNGTLVRPRMVHHVVDGEGTLLQESRPEILRTLPVSAETWSLVKQGMEAAVAYGTAPRARIDGVRVAGKTGTAQYCDDIALATGDCGVGYAQPEHAWFSAFAPVDDPVVSVIVFIYHGGEGSITAVPVARDILEYYFNRYGFPS